MAGNNFFVPTKQLWAARQASPGRPRKKLVPISSEKLQIEAKSQILTFNDFFKNFSEGALVKGSFTCDVCTEKPKRKSKRPSNVGTLKGNVWMRVRFVEWIVDRRAI